MDSELLGARRRKRLLVTSGVLAAAMVAVYLLVSLHLEIVTLAVLWVGYLFLSLRQKRQGKAGLILYPSLQPLADFDAQVLGTKTKRVSPVFGLAALSYFLLVVRRDVADLGPHLFAAMWFGAGFVLLVIIVVVLLYNDRKVDRVAAQQRNAESPAAPQ